MNLVGPDPNIFCSGQQLSSNFSELCIGSAHGALKH